MLSIINQLSNNKIVFLQLLKEIDNDTILWKPSPEKWNLLYIVCHLFDEECEDFRFRINWLLNNPGKTPPSFNPLKWVEERNYKNQVYDDMLQKFIYEREQSVNWLRNLKNVAWNNSFKHPKLGDLSARYFLNNWLAHDYLHIRQILKLKFDYLQYQSGRDLNYAGNW